MGRSLIKLFLALLLVIFQAGEVWAAAAETKTSNLGLTKPFARDGSWGDRLNENFDILDALFPGGLGGPSIQDEGVDLARRQKLNFTGGAVTCSITSSTVITCDFTGGGGGGGGGDASTNTSVSVDSELALFSGTSGKTLKRATQTGILGATSGVIGSITTSAAIAGFISDETGSGALVFGTSPTIVTPTIASFTNATHSHANAAGGGNIAEAALSLTDITTNNATAGRHGFLPKLSGSTSDCFRGDGTYVACAGGGDASTNTTVSVDNEVVLFSGIGGKTLKRATSTGVAHLSSGVLSASNVNLATEVTGNLAVTHLNSGTNASGSTCWKGDGTWGSCGAGAGDVSSNTSTSVDGEVALFSGTLGKTIKRSTIVESGSTLTIGNCGTNCATIDTSLVTGSKTYNLPNLGGTFVLTSNNASVLAATTSAQWATVLTDETGTGAAVFATNPSLVTPTIASFINATHSHLNSAGGGQLTEAALSLSDVTTNNASTSAHGFLPKLNNNNAQCISGQGNWVSCSSGVGTPGGASGTIQYNDSGTLNGGPTYDATNRVVTVGNAANAARTPDSGIRRVSPGVLKATDGGTGNGTFQGNFNAQDGTAGHTGASCTAWKNGLCTAG